MADSDSYLKEFNRRLDRARLLHAAPERVFEAFRATADKGSIGDSDIEVALLSRGDPQINLALAAYAGNIDVVRALYHGSTSRLRPTLKERLRDGSIKAKLLALNDPYVNSRLAAADNDEFMLEALYKSSPLYLADTSVEVLYKRELRHACLSNRHAVVLSTSGLAGGLGRTDEDLVASLLAEADDGREDLATLMKNPTVGDKVLANLFKHAGTFEKVDDNTWRLLVLWASDNPRLAKPSQDSSDGPDLAAWNIREGIERLLNTEPPADDSERSDWAVAVRTVLETAHESLRPYRVNTQRIFAKWSDANSRQDTAGGDTDERLEVDNRGEQRLLCYLIAALFAVAPAEGGSVDSAPDGWMAQLRRCAHYGKDHLSVADLDTGNAKDGDAFVAAVLCNNGVLIDDNLRGHLMSVCGLRRSDWPRDEWNVRWFVIWAQKVYERKCEQLRKDHPWVRADTPNPAEANLESPNAAQRLTLASRDDPSSSLARSLESFKRWVVIGFVVVILVLLFRR